MQRERHKPATRGRQYRSAAKGRSARSSVEVAVMAMERRGRVIQSGMGDQLGKQEESRMTASRYDIPKALVWEAWLASESQ